jgi:electron transfer flavoprotein beta subunit
MQKIERLYVPGSQKQTRKLEGPAGEVAKKLVEYLRNDARAL